MKSYLAVSLTLLVAIGVVAQQAAPPPAPAPSSQAVTQVGQEVAFVSAANEVLQVMSKILDLPVKQPLKESVRTKEQIRAYLVQEQAEDKDAPQRYADRRALEAFGLIPPGFPLDSFMLDLLTDQVAGLYDPKSKEFYIANWISPAEQKPVMAHELTHALDDQYFHIDKWEKAARPNDDAELARDAVIEGSALAAMFDYMFRDQNRSVRDLPDLSLLLEAGVLSEFQKDPKLSKLPAFIRDSLLFPYIAGTAFTQQFLKAHTGWADFKEVFVHPPLSTQQIIHPQLYLDGVKPREVTLPEFKGILPPGYNLLEENVLGEFSLQEVLKQHLGSKRAGDLSPLWAGDRYALFENQGTKQLMLFLRLALDNAGGAKRFFNAYGQLLEHKYPSRTREMRQLDYLQFDSPDGGVFLRCDGEGCLSVEGATREVFDKINRAIGWPPAPAAMPAPPKRQARQTSAIALER